MDEEVEDPIICTQLDQNSGSELSDRGQNIARRCRCWGALGVEDANFIYCIRNAVGSEIEFMNFKCKQCGLGSGRKYRH